MSFNFDPFAAPAPAAPAGTGNANANGGSSVSRSAGPPAAPTPIVATNPFDNFGFVQPKTSNNSNNAASSQSNGSGNDWQQTARAAMTGGAWKGSLGGSTPLSSSHRSNSAASLNAKRVPKRVVQYTSPISTLESNWDPWLYAAQSSSPQSLWTNGGNNNATYLVVRANEGCCLAGGVESVLRWSKQRASRASGAGGIGIEAELSGNLNSGLSFSESQDDNGPSNITYGSAVINQSSSHASSKPNNKQNNLSLSGSGRQGSGGGVGLGSMRFLKSGLKKAQQSFERSVTTMAIKADGGKNPDQLCVSLHYLGGLHGNNVNLNMWNALGYNNINLPTVGGAGGGQYDVGDVCLARTEWVELPSNMDSTGDDVEGLLFSIPLCIPDLSFLEAAAAGGNNGNAPGVQLTIRLYIRSGAVILKAVANREYCIGESSFLYSNVMGLMQHPQQQQQQQSTNGGGLKCGTINVPFTTGMLAETASFSNNSFSSHSNSSNGYAPAALHITATPRVKFNAPCTFGWSLTDPIATPPTGATSWLKMFQLPLDQAYVFHMLYTHLHHHRLLNNGQQQRQQQIMAPSNSAVLLANERAVESCVSLPLATACCRLFSTAASHSQLLALTCADKTRCKDAVHLSPQEDEYRSKAVIEAALLEGCALVELGVVALVLLGEAPPVDMGLGVCGAFEGFENNVPSVRASVTFQPPHTIFEESLGRGSCPLLDETTGAQYIKNPNAGTGGPKEAITARFCPRVLTGQDNLLPGVAGTRPDGRYVGSIRLEVLVDYANSAVDTISTGISGGTAVEGLVELEKYLDLPQQQQEGRKVPVLIPGIDANTGRRIGTFVLLLSVTSNGGSRISPTNPSASSTSSDENAVPSAGGLVSVVGMDTLTEQLGISPYLDCDAPLLNSHLVSSPPTPNGVRKRQVATMGSFASPRYLVHQANVVRKRDMNVLTDRHDKYYKSLMSGLATDTNDGVEDETDLPVFQRRNPRSFRPSNSRGDALLSSIGFNIHVQSLSLNVLQDGVPAMQAAVTQSVTHGAPADHAKGFGGEVMGDDGKAIMDTSKDSSAPRGGLRRLESKRVEFVKELDNSIVGLISSVGDHFKRTAQATSMRQQAGIKPSRHIPPNLPAIMHYRTKAGECTERLHSLTWDIAVRRANCFSQALGIAVTSYLASLSDGGPAWRGYASTWARHGYLITFEGLLSAVGKELGMIEDASVAISMLRMVSVVLVPANANSNTSQDGNEARIPVPHSPYVRWVHLISTTMNGSHSKSQYRLEIGLDPSYYQNRVPDPLKNGVAVRFFPVLFQMGVDIRQWGVNAGRNVTSQIKQDKSKDAESAADVVDAQPSGSLLDDGDEDDEVGVASNEILLELNVEGYRKLNAYAHSANPTTAGVTAASAPIPVFDSLEQAQAQPLPLHPSLVSLSEGIKASASKMEHSVMDRAATACQRFGGGSTVFCKSGKDRTAMQVTFKQAQFVQRFIDKKDNTSMMEDTPISYGSVFSKSTLMRKHGNRIPICEKNTGEPKFAFNPLQRKFMPEMLRLDASLCTWSKPET